MSTFTIPSLTWCSSTVVAVKCVVPPDSFVIASVVKLPKFAPSESEPSQTIINLLTVSCSITRPNLPDDEPLTVWPIVIALFNVV